MEIVLALVAVMLVLMVALGVYTVVRLVGAAKRGVDRTIGQARRTVEDSTLRARSYTQSGPAGELARLRLRLRTSMRATQDALESRVDQDLSLRESLSLFQRLSVHGRELEAELKRLESEPDRSALAGRLPELRARTQRITESADKLRWAAHDRAERHTGEDLDSLSAQIDMEAGALRHWTTTDPGPTDPTSRPAPPAGERTAGENRPGERPDSTPASPGDGGWSTARPMIESVVRRTAQSWRKKSRPENTT